MNKQVKNQSQKRVGTSKYQTQVVKERCKECGFCIEFCPQKALIKSAEINTHGYHIVCSEDSDKCTGCNICVMLCPEFAINIVPDREEAGKAR